MKHGKMPEKPTSFQSHIPKQHQKKALFQPTFRKSPVNQVLLYTFLKGLEILIQLGDTLPEYRCYFRHLYKTQQHPLFCSPARKDEATDF